MTHIEYMNIIILVTGSIVGCAGITELFIAWYSGKVSYMLFGQSYWSAGGLIGYDDM